MERINRFELLKLWDLEDVPLCDMGLDLAKDFLVSCGLAVAKINERNSAATRQTST
jgi:hypothetical protein